MPMSDDTADAIHVLTNLGPTLRTVRTLRGLSLREVARQTGLSFSTVKRIEDGDDCVLSHAILALKWIGDR